MKEIIKSNNVILDAEWNEKYDTDGFEEITYYLVDEEEDIYDEIFSFHYYLKEEVVDGQPAWQNKQRHIAIDEMISYGEYEETAREHIELSDFLNEIEYLKDLFENIDKHINMDLINKFLK